MTIVPPGVGDFRESRDGADELETPPGVAPRGDALLLLRRPVRHVPEGRRPRSGLRDGAARPRHQPGEALPEGRHRLPAGQPPRPLALPADARRGGERLRRASWDEALDRVAAEIRRIQDDARPRRLRRVLGLVAHHRDHLPDGQVRPRGAAARSTSTTTAASAWSRPRPRTRRRSASTVPRTRGRTCSTTQADPVRRLERRRVLPGDVALRLGRSRPRREADRDRPAGDAAGAHRRPLRAAAPGHRRARSSTACCTSIAREGWLDDRSSPSGPSAGRRSARSVARLRPGAGRRDLRDRAGTDRGRRARCGARPSARWRSTRAGSSTRSKASRTRCRIINLVLATGQIGAPGKGYGTITGQGNGQGGREHGQKADQLPGQRDIENPEHRAFIARLLGDRARRTCRTRASPRSSSST